ncbi:bifunctional adenosylcobinamide kinase/adenosylcobinamide-phosphate guanylyltransferase [Acidovorax sp. SUPP950]|uniref:bifunctional adenosylcobinamide kinase/adenosylcobinamide-phosphate guanylyltransferase n=1 Tax=unclassified Acidovorax TaxID=2684926 RepID=UPI0023C8624E|nr:MULTISPECIES: bifunctional adenosylcobinamide kinase/adenosylcobinamide-phosphate guanylyltransferase [Comamonadaceae]WOI43870.1 bifunctional adenosylcobinamide kinase/adenosylcobinamide-phosphate guanylyltransferase [Paracidovorax avenae]GKS74049.1 bifunctional adenosylcobinamide kinase/adenosylcobinamide-phosphate guanylyltransferase [Acidovorax sp. SUPP950]
MSGPGPIATSELILGGQKSGKSRRAELLARQWLADSPTHRALLIATGQPWDDEMRERIARHQRDRAERVPGLRTLEEPLDLARAIARHGSADTLIVVDCLTLWLTNWLMPAPAPAPVSEGSEPDRPPAHDWLGQCAMFLGAIRQCPGPVVLVGNEIGLGVIPMGREVRAFVDALGSLNQRVAEACQRVTLVAAGLPLTLKDTP